MKKLFLSTVATLLLSVNAFASDSMTNSKSDVNYKNSFTIDNLGTCTMTFTAYNSAGEALYSWTEEYWAYSYQNCQDLGKYRLEQLNSGL
jgi:hypothetical protein